MLGGLVVSIAEWIAILGAWPAFANGQKVDVCHRPPGNPDNVRLIEICVPGAQRQRAKALGGSRAASSRTSQDTLCPALPPRVAPGATRSVLRAPAAAS